MPELPEVETIVRQTRPLLEGRQIARFVSRWTKSVAPGYAAVRRALAARTVTTVWRRAKLIIWDLDDGAHLLIHLRMSGRLEWLNGRPDRTPFVRSYWELTDGRRLALCDVRKFGRITLTRDLAAATAHLGPEPLSRGFTTQRLAALLTGRQRQLKPLLLDQSRVAGLGNIYVDEALYRAKLHPLRRAATLSAAEVATLHTAIRAVLREAVRYHGSSIDWMYPGGWMQDRLRVYGRDGEACRRCGAAIEKLTVAQRGTHVCPTCQPLTS